MTEKKYKLENIRNNYESYNELINFNAKFKDFQFTEILIILEGWFAANMCSLLGAIASRFQSNFNKVIIEPGKARDILERNGFLSFFGEQRKADYYETTISYLTLDPEDQRYFNDYVSTEFLGKDSFPEMSEGVRRRFAKSIYEVFNNSAIHSKTEQIFSCGQFYPQKGKIIFTITDTGIGIRESVNRRFGSNLTAVQAIEWAMQEGNTTKEGVSGGIGLAYLKEFIDDNEGCITLISNDGYIEYTKSGIEKKNLNCELSGTVVSLSINTIEKMNRTAAQLSADDIF